MSKPAVAKSPMATPRHFLVSAPLTGRVLPPPGRHAYASRPGPSSAGRPSLAPAPSCLPGGGRTEGLLVLGTSRCSVLTQVEYRDPRRPSGLDPWASSSDRSARRAPSLDRLTDDLHEALRATPTATCRPRGSGPPHPEERLSARPGCAGTPWRRQPPKRGCSAPLRPSG